MERPQTLTNFLEAAKQAALATVPTGSDAETAANRIFNALEKPAELVEAEPSTELPAYAHLPTALSNAALGPHPIRNLSTTLGALAPGLSWQRRANAETDGESFYDGHANTTVIGPHGIEPRSDVIIGVSLVAPGVRYPQHNHPPEELYIVMSEGDWYREGRGWYTPGIGAVVYHQPGITHAMRSSQQPLLAVWCLWAGRA